jgi:hypothetical protein
MLDKDSLDGGELWQLIVSAMNEPFREKSKSEERRHWATMYCRFKPTHRPARSFSSGQQDSMAMA